MKLGNRLDFQARLFPGFPDRRRLQGFTVIYEPPWQSPRPGFIPPVNQDNPLPPRLWFYLDDDVHRRDGTYVPDYLRSTLWAVNFFSLHGPTSRFRSLLPSFYNLLFLQDQANSYEKRRSP